MDKLKNLNLRTSHSASPVKGKAQSSKELMLSSMGDKFKRLMPVPAGGKTPEDSDSERPSKFVSREAEHNFEMKQYLKDMEVLQKAHKVVVRRNEYDKQQQLKRDYDFEAAENFSQFVKFNSIKDCIDEIVVPIVNQVPAVRKELADLKRLVDHIKEQRRLRTIEFKSMQQQIKEIHDIKMSHLRTDQQMAEQNIIITKFQYDVDEYKSDMSAKLDTIDRQLEENKENIFTQDKKIKNFEQTIKNNHRAMLADLEMHTKSLSEHAAKMLHSVNDLGRRQAEVELTTVELKKQVNTSLQKTVREIHESCLTNTKTVDRIEARIKSVERQFLAVRTMQSTLDEMTDWKKETLSQNMFLVNCLPTLISLNVIDALHSVVPDRQKLLLRYEKHKLAELEQFSSGQIKGGHKAIMGLMDRMSNKLKYLLAVYNQTGCGTLGVFDYNVEFGGKDPSYPVTGDMMQDLTRALAQRCEDIQSNDRNLEEAFLQVAAEGDMFNPTMMMHKVGKLNEEGLTKLHERVVASRIIKNKIYDDLLVDVPEDKMEILRAKSKKAPPKKKPTTSPTPAPKLPTYQATHSTLQSFRQPPQPPVYPDKIFVLRRDHLRPYLRLDKKYSDLFDRAIADFNQFRDSEIKNFTRTTQMTMQLNSDLDIVKLVVQSVQATLEETEAAFRQKIEGLEGKLQRLEDGHNAKIKDEATKVTKLQATCQEFLRFRDEERQHAVEFSKMLANLEQEIANTHDTLAELECGQQQLVDAQAEVSMKIDQQMLLMQINESKKRRREQLRARKETVLLDAKFCDDLPRINEEDLGTPRAADELGRATLAVVNSNDSIQSNEGDGKEEQSHLLTVDNRDQSAEPSSRGDSQRTNRRAYEKSAGAMTINSKKNQTKQKLLAQMDEKKRKDEIAAKRRKERELREEKQRQLQAEKEAEEAREQEKIERQKALERELEEKMKARKELFDKMNAASKTNRMSAVFISNLGAQRQKTSVAKQRLQSRLAVHQNKLAATVKHSTKTVTAGLSKDIIKEKRGARRATVVEEPTRERGSVSSDFSSDDSGDDAAFVNPFELLKKRAEGPPPLDEAKVLELVEPRLKTLTEKIGEDILPQLAAMKKTSEERFKHLEDSNITNLKMVEINIAQSDKKMKSMTETLKNIESHLQVELKGLDEQIQFEKTQIGKMKRQMRAELDSEVAKMRELEGGVTYEMARVNSLIDRQIEAVELLIQDQMLAQLLAEQDVLDRKQIALYGLKGNQEMLGRQQTSQNQMYERVSPLRASSIIRKREQELAGIRSPGPQPNQTLNNDLKDDSLVKLQETAKVVADGTFMARYQQQADYDSIRLDNKCVSCQQPPGQLSHILTLTKLACLSYVNSPICYGPLAMHPELQQRPNDASKCLTMTVPEAISLKERLLLNCQKTVQHCAMLKRRNPSFFEKMVASKTGKRTTLIKKASVVQEPTEPYTATKQYSELGGGPSTHEVSPKSVVKTVIDHEHMADRSGSVSDLEKERIFEDFRVAEIHSINMPKFNIPMLNEIIEERRRQPEKAFDLQQTIQMVSDCSMMNLDRRVARESLTMIKSLRLTLKNEKDERLRSMSAFEDPEHNEEVMQMIGNRLTGYSSQKAKHNHLKAKISINQRGSQQKTFQSQATRVKETLQKPQTANQRRRVLSMVQASSPDEQSIIVANDATSSQAYENFRLIPHSMASNEQTQLKHSRTNKMRISVPVQNAPRRNLKHMTTVTTPSSMVFNMTGATAAHTVKQTGQNASLAQINQNCQTIKQSMETRESGLSPTSVADGIQSRPLVAASPLNLYSSESVNFANQAALARNLGQRSSWNMRLADSRALLQSSLSDARHNYDFNVVMSPQNNHEVLESEDAEATFMGTISPAAAGPATLSPQAMTGASKRIAIPIHDFDKLAGHHAAQRAQTNLGSRFSKAPDKLRSQVNLSVNVGKRK